MLNLKVVGNKMLTTVANTTTTKTEFKLTKLGEMRALIKTTLVGERVLIANTDIKPPKPQHGTNRDYRWNTKSDAIKKLDQSNLPVLSKYGGHINTQQMRILTKTKLNINFQVP